MTPRRAIVIAALAIVAGVGWLLLQPAGEKVTSGPPMVAVAVPDLTAYEIGGNTLFEANCAVCHGRNAAGQDGVAPPLVHKIYEPNHHADESFQIAVARGVRSHHWNFGNMPAIEGLSRDDVTRIVAYVRALQRANGIN